MITFIVHLHFLSAHSGIQYIYTVDRGRNVRSAVSLRILKGSHGWVTIKQFGTSTECIDALRQQGAEIWALQQSPHFFTYTKENAEALLKKEGYTEDTIKDLLPKANLTEGQSLFPSTPSLPLPLEPYLFGSHHHRAQPHSSVTQSFVEDCQSQCHELYSEMNKGVTWLEENTERNSWLQDNESSTSSTATTTSTSTTSSPASPSASTTNSNQIDISPLMERLRERGGASFKGETGTVRGTAPGSISLSDSSISPSSNTNNGSSTMHDGNVTMTDNDNARDNDRKDETSMNINKNTSKGVRVERVMLGDDEVRTTLNKISSKVQREKEQEKEDKELAAHIAATASAYQQSLVAGGLDDRLVKALKAAEAGIYQAPPGSEENKTRKQQYVYRTPLPPPPTIRLAGSTTSTSPSPSTSSSAQPTSSPTTLDSDNISLFGFPNLVAIVVGVENQPVTLPFALAADRHVYMPQYGYVSFLFTTLLLFTRPSLPPLLTTP